MDGYQIPEAPEVEGAYRAAYRAFEGVASAGSFVPEAELSLSEVVSQFRALVRGAEMALAAQIGPLVSWEAPARDTDWTLVFSGVDLDSHSCDFGDAELGDDAFKGADGTWHGSALDCAARAYKRASGWDFAPDGTGVWLVMLAPVWGSGGDNEWHYTGHLAGFVVLYDRANDGVYESVGHVWTAAAWCRQGIARRLLTEARSRFGFTCIEGPYTADGAALVAAWERAEQTASAGGSPAGLPGDPGTGNGAPAD